MVNISVVEKATRKAVEQSGDDVLLRAPSVVTIGAAPEQIVSVARNGSRLGMRLEGGDTVTIDNFFDAKGKPLGELVIYDEAGDASWLAVYSAETGEVTLSPVASDDGVTVNAGPAPALESTAEPAAVPQAPDLPPTLHSASASTPLAAPTTAAAAEAGSMLPLVAFSAAGLGLGAREAWIATRHDSDDSVRSVHAPDEPASADLALTSNNMYGLAGTAGPGATVVLTQPDGSMATTVADAGGVWQFDPNPLGDGEHGTVTVVAPDGRAAASIDTGIADVTPPAAPGVDYNNAGGLGGTGDANDTIVVELPDGSTVTTTVSEDGHWQFQTNPLPDGGAAVVTEVDPAGNVSGPTSTGANELSSPVALDSANLNLVDEAAAVPGTIAHGAWIGDAASVNVYDNAALVGGATVEGAGNGFFESARPLAGGAHDFQAAPAEAAGRRLPVDAPTDATADMLTLDSLLSDEAGMDGSATAAGAIASTTPTATQMDLLMALHQPPLI